MTIYPLEVYERKRQGHNAAENVESCASMPEKTVHVEEEGANRARFRLFGSAAVPHSRARTARSRSALAQGESPNERGCALNATGRQEAARIEQDLFQNAAGLHAAPPLPCRRAIVPKTHCCLYYVIDEERRSSISCSSAIRDKTRAPLGPCGSATKVSIPSMRLTGNC